MKVRTIVLLVSLLVFAKASSSATAAAAAANGNQGGNAAASSAAAASNGANNRGAASAASSAAASNGGSAAASSAAAAGDSAAASAAAAAGDSAAASAAAAAGDNAAASASAGNNAAVSASAGSSASASAGSSAAASAGSGKQNSLQVGRKSSQQINCADDEFLYQYTCLKKTCLTNKLSRIHLNPFDSKNGTLGTLDTGIRGDIRVLRDQGNIVYQIKVSYHDNYDNQILGDRQNCVDFRLYQTANSYEIDPTRLSVSGSDSTQPSYPVSYYSFSQTNSAGMVGFNMSQSDLEKKCLKFTSSSQQTTTWECYYEFAFVVQQVTQVSYYFCVKVSLNNMVADSLPAVNFEKIVQYDRCQDKGPCTVNVNIDSSLYFCKDRSCKEISLSPYYVLFLNRPFQMKYQIDSPSFKNYFIYNEVVTYQSDGFSLKLTEQDQEVAVVNRQPGWNVLELRVPIVAESVIISISGSVSQTLSQNARLLLDKTDDGVTSKNVQSHASLPAGAVVEPNANVIKTKQQQINSQKQSSDSITLALGFTLLGAALLH